MKSNEVPYTSRAGWYRLMYPRPWAVEETDECTSLYDPREGVGALQISAYQTPTPQVPEEVLLEYLDDNGVAVGARDFATRVAKGKSEASYEYERDNKFHKVWIVSNRTFLLLITYIRSRGGADAEASAVGRIVNSIELADSAV